MTDRCQCYRMCLLGHIGLQPVRFFFLFPGHSALMFCHASQHLILMHNARFSICMRHAGLLNNSSVSPFCIMRLITSI